MIQSSELTGIRPAGGQEGGQNLSPQNSRGVGLDRMIPLRTKSFLTPRSLQGRYTWCMLILYA